MSTRTDWGTLARPPVKPWPGEHRELLGRSTYVRRAGTPGAPVAVFIHGLGGASTNWTDLMLLLGGELDCYALDLPGFGRSDPPADGRYPLDVHVGAVIALIESLGSELPGGGAVHLFGNSLGGATATRVAARCPELVRSLTLVSPALPDLKPRLGIDLRLPLMFLPGIGPRVQKRLASAPVDSRVAATMKLVFFDLSAIPDVRLQEAADELARRDGLAWSDAAMLGSLRGLVAAQAIPGPRGLWADAARVAAPTLLIWGRHDKLVNVRVSAQALTRFRDASLLVLEDAGHVAQLERPQAVADAFRARFGDTVLPGPQ